MKKGTHPACRICLLICSHLLAAELSLSLSLSGQIAGEAERRNLQWQALRRQAKKDWNQSRRLSVESSSAGGGEAGAGAGAGAEAADLAALEEQLSRRVRAEEGEGGLPWLQELADHLARSVVECLELIREVCEYLNKVDTCMLIFV